MSVPNNIVTLYSEELLIKNEKYSCTWKPYQFIMSSLVNMKLKINSSLKSVSNNKWRKTNPVIENFNDKTEK